MFDELIRDLKRMEREPVTLSIEADEDGYFDRQCPNEDCAFQFKVVLDDWEEGFADQEMYCPLCGKLAPANHYWTAEHLAMAEEQAVRHISGRLGQAMSRDAHRFNRRQPRDSFITMSLDYRGSTHVPCLAPLAAAEEMQLKIGCEKCCARFAVIGSAFFCAKCGHSSAVRVFHDSLTKVEAKITHLDRVVRAVAEVDKDGAELTRRSLLESGLSDSVVAFQRVMEELYRRHPNAAMNPQQNAFQRLREGSDLWQQAAGFGYDDVLTSDELSQLTVQFQRRHLLAHKEGIVDEQYVQRSGDVSYAPGQRIVVSPSNVLDVVGLVHKLVSAYMPSESVS